VSVEGGEDDTHASSVSPDVEVPCVAIVNVETVSVI
jgi:hypothetical protein